MELSDSGKSISFFSRIAFQIPSIALSTLTMIAISRNLGPGGRGEVSQILLLAGLTSSILCTPIFLTVMYLDTSTEIKSYINRTLLIIDWRILTSLALLNTSFILINYYNGQESNLLICLLLDLLVLSYFISSQIRDVLLRYHKNKIYGLDFALQIVIATAVLYLLVLQRLTVLHVIQIFTFAYGLFAFSLLVIFKLRVTEFSFANLVKKDVTKNARSQSWRTNNPFSNLGILFQLALSKDLLIGLLILPRIEFGLMSALASFWVVVRFLRPSALIQVKLDPGDAHTMSFASKRILAIIGRPISAIQTQAVLIVITGLIGCYLTPRLLGSGFSPSIDLAIYGIASEILLMKCLYDLSISTSRFLQNLFAGLLLLQISTLVFLETVGTDASITLIWLSSIICYLLWQAISRSRSRP